MTLLLSLSVQGLSVSLRGPCYCLSLCKNLTVVSHSSVMYFNLHGASCYWSLPGSFSNSDSKAIHLQFFNIFISYIQYICRKCIMSILTRGLLLFFCQRVMIHSILLCAWWMHFGSFTVASLSIQFYPHCLPLVRELINLKHSSLKKTVLMLLFISSDQFEF